MVTKDMWKGLMPGYISGGRPVALTTTTQIADATNQIALSVGRKVYRINYPRVVDRMMRIGTQNYVGITLILRPIITNIGTGRDRRVSINNHHGESIDIFVMRDNPTPTCKWGHRFYYSNIPQREFPRFRRFQLRPVDMEWMAGKYDREDKPYVTPADLRFCYGLFKAAPEWEWKNVTDMRWLGIEESFLYYIMSKLQWMSYPNVEEDVVQRSMDRFWVGNPQIQWIDPNGSALAQVALLDKVHIPVGHFDKLEDLLPHKSWVGVLDSLTTPQSEKAGTIISWVDWGQHEFPR